MITRRESGRGHLLILATAILCFGAASRAQSSATPDSPKQIADAAIRVEPEIAEKNLVKKVDPVYPAIAKMARLQGTVKLQVGISKTGTVEFASFLSGPPLLMQAAVTAVKQWQYTPFLSDGLPVAVSTEVAVPFSLGISDSDYRAEQKNSTQYFKREDECRNLLKVHQYPEAENSCVSLVELAEKLPKERQNERRTANALAGHVFLYERKFDEALRYFKNEVAVGEASLKPTDAELGYGYHDVAVAYQFLGDTRKAEVNYELAKNTLEKARQHIDSDFLKKEYAKALQSVLQDYLTLLQQTGQTDAAEKVQQRAAALTHENQP